MDSLRAEPGSIEELIDACDVAPLPRLGWLGQAGFLLRCQALCVAVDPYLSDSLADKYRGTKFPHTRLTAPPVSPDRLVTVRAVLCTHAHTDHMDPLTLSAIARANANCRFVVPRAESRTAVERGVPEERLIPIDAEERLPVCEGLTVCALPSAHERLETDPEGRQRFLGYVLELEGARIYHSGDCVPYDGLAERLAAQRVDLALLPVNGRDAERRTRGVPGNFTFAEAVELCQRAGIPAMLACHFGMFEFNTVDPAWLDEQIRTVAGPPQCVRPRAGMLYRLQPGSAKPAAEPPSRRTMG